MCIVHCLLRTITTVAGWLARSPWWCIKRPLIWLVMHCFGVTLEDFEKERPADYRTFDEFFTRKLRQGARAPPEGEHCLASPVDGTLTAICELQNNTILQVKGLGYTVDVFVPDPSVDSHDLCFTPKFGITIYLSPRDYHRIHAPQSGELLALRYDPGYLYSVGINLVARRPDIMQTNERATMLFQTQAHGKMSLTMVAATNVSGIETRWTRIIDRNFPRRQWVRHSDIKITDAPAEVEQGDELGMFHFGSSIVLLCEHVPSIPEQLLTGDYVRILLHQTLGMFNNC